MITWLSQLYLEEHEKVVLKRYIENELQQEDFLTCEGYVQIKEEAFVFVYVAGHGCADTSQYFVLNEHDIDKAFWKIEDKLMRLA